MVRCTEMYTNDPSSNEVRSSDHKLLRKLLTGRPKLRNADSYVCTPTTIHQNTHIFLKTNHPHNARLGDSASFRSEQTECVFQFFLTACSSNGAGKTALGWSTV